MSFLRPHLPLLAALALLWVGLLAAMNSQNNLLFWVAGVIGAGIIVSAALATLVMRNLDVRRLDPKHGVVGDPLVVHYSLTNRSRWLPAFNVFVQEMPVRGSGGARSTTPFSNRGIAWVMHVGPGETVHGEAVLWPRERGEATFDRLRAWTTFPFGMLRRSRTRSQPIHTLIFPRVYGLKRGVLDSIMPAGPLGMKLSVRPGGGDDYFGLREYKPGDSRRQIAWKRSAGSDMLIIKERTLPSPPRLRIVLNLATPTDAISFDRRKGLSARDLEERAISLAATFIDVGHREGYEVGLSVMGFDVPVTPLRRSHWHVEKIMGALAGLNLGEPRLRAEARTRADAERAGIVVIHPGRVEPSMARSEAWHFSAEQIEHLVGRRGVVESAAKPPRAKRERNGTVGPPASRESSRSAGRAAAGAGASP